jgi:hypothetical protein
LGLDDKVDGGLQMAVKVDHSDWAVRTIDTAKQRQSDGMIATESNYSGKSLP